MKIKHIILAAMLMIFCFSSCTRESGNDGEDNYTPVFVLANNGEDIKLRIDNICDWDDIIPEKGSFLVYHGSNIFYMVRGDEESQLYIYSTEDRTTTYIGPLDFNWIGTAEIIGGRYIVFIGDIGNRKIYVYDTEKEELNFAGKIDCSSIVFYTAAISSHEIAYLYKPDEKDEDVLEVLDTETLEIREIYRCEYVKQIDCIGFDGQDICILICEYGEDDKNFSVRKISLDGKLREEVSANGIKTSEYDLFQSMDMTYMDSYCFINGDGWGTAENCIVGQLFDPENDYSPVSPANAQLATFISEQSGGKIRLFTSINKNRLAAVDTQKHLIYYICPDIDGYNDLYAVIVKCNEKGDIILIMYDLKLNKRMAMISAEAINEAIYSEF